MIFNQELQGLTKLVSGPPENQKSVLGNQNYGSSCPEDNNNFRVIVYNITFYQEDTINKGPDYCDLVFNRPIPVRIGFADCPKLSIFLIHTLGAGSYETMHCATNMCTLL